MTQRGQFRVAFDRCSAVELEKQRWNYRRIG
jgi:hypothetical protein